MRRATASSASEVIRHTCAIQIRLLLLLLLSNFIRRSWSISSNFGANSLLDVHCYLNDVLFRNRRIVSSKGLACNGVKIIFFSPHRPYCKHLSNICQEVFSLLTIYIL